MAVARKKIYTPEEYLALEEHSDIRHEFVSGEIFDMAGSSARHNDIVQNVNFALQSTLRQRTLPCRIYTTDLRLRIKKANTYTYPDLMLICGKLEFDAGRQDVILNPTVIIEVLSPSTSNYDHTRKFAAYRQIPSLEEYIMIDQESVSVERFRRDQTKFWVLEALEAITDTLDLKSVDVEIPLSAIYAQIEFQEP